MVRLMELITVDGVVQEIREVRKEIEIVGDAVRGDLRRRVAARALPLGGSAVAIAVAAVGRIDGTESIDEAVVDRPLWNLIGGVPPSRIGHAGYREPVHGIALAVAQERIHLAIVVGADPRSVVVLEVERGEQMSAPDGWRCGSHHMAEA